jgi:hypothetical protein
MGKELPNVYIRNYRTVHLGCLFADCGSPPQESFFVDLVVLTLSGNSPHP